MPAILDLILGFLGKYWKHIIIIVSIVASFFIVRHVILDKIEQHDQAIIATTIKAKDDEWQSKLDKAQIKFQEDLENARKNQKALAAQKPRNQRAVVDLLHKHKLNSPD